ncbi:MAG: type II toxin-antitoxin system VapC family toxin [Patescibacteria group bacterium]
MVVLDASVILKWFRDEPDSEKALVYRSEHVSGKQQIVCPILLHYELVNALVTKRDLSIRDVTDILKDLQRSQILLASPSIVEDEQYAAIIAMEKGISYYDASYIALAHRLKANLITADKKLIEKVNLPFVISL